MFEEIEEQKGTHEILRDCVAVIIYNNYFFNSVSSKELSLKNPALNIFTRNLESL